MGFFSSLFSGGLYSISENDKKAMTAKEGYIRFALRYVGGHTNYPSRIESVIEISHINNPDNIINVYANQSSAGLEVQPGNFLFSIALRNIIKIENNTQKEFSGAFLIHGLGAILQETRFVVAIHYRDDQDIKQHAVFWTTPAIKSKKYYEIFYQDFMGTMMEVNPKALSGDEPEEVTKTDISYQIEKLAGLKATGMLTDEEFSIAKSKVLNKMDNESSLKEQIESNSKTNLQSSNPTQSIKGYKITIRALPGNILYDLKIELNKDFKLNV